MTQKDSELFLLLLVMVTGRAQVLCLQFGSHARDLGIGWEVLSFENFIVCKFTESLLHLVDKFLARN